jgi:hypothetical protein
MDADDSFRTDSPADTADKVSAPRRRMRAVGAAAPLCVTSDLGMNETVSEQEIRLIMSALGGKLAEILNPGRCE